jgi:hypothetical protein
MNSTAEPDVSRPVIVISGTECRRGQAQVVPAGKAQFPHAPFFDPLSANDLASE